MDIFIGIIEQGLTYSFLALGLYISYIIIDFPDLTIDGSFPLGAAISVTLISMGINPLIAMIISLISGMLAGFLTGFIHIKLGVKDLLAGLISQTALYTINLTIAGSANVAIITEDIIFSNNIINKIIPESLSKYRVLIVMIPMVLIVKFLLDKFLNTQRGFLFKAIGDNPTLVKTMGIDPGIIKIQGIALANGLVALSGSIVAQEQRFFEISMGTGAMVMGLASLILGLKLFSRFNKINSTSKVVLGSILYKASISLAIALGFSANSMKLITAIIFLLILVIGDRKTFRRKVKNA